MDYLGNPTPGTYHAIDTVAKPYHVLPFDPPEPIGELVDIRATAKVIGPDAGDAPVAVYGGIRGWYEPV